MIPQIFIYKGFVIFDPGDNLQLCNKLRESTFLTMHPRGRQYFCMVNNSAIIFIKAHEEFLRKNFAFTREVEDLLDQEELSYVPLWEKELYVPTFDGIKWKKHQEIALDYISKYKRFCIFLGPGTGKTLIALATIEMIECAHPKGNTYLVVTPKKAIPQYTTETLKYLPKANIILKPDTPILKNTINIVITNYESINKYTKLNYKCMILDESHKAKNVSSLVNKTLCKINAEAIYLFTGTPQDKQRDEIFAQLKILNNNLFTLKYLFYARYFILDDYYKPIKELHREELTEIISKCTYGDKTENLIDLPQEVEEEVTCQLDSLKETYKKFKKDKVLKGKGWYALGDSGAKHRTKLTQLCSGFIYDDGGIPHRTPYNPKKNKLIELLQKCPQAIIYTCYDEEQKIISEILTKLKKKFVCVNGHSKDSAESLKKFKEGTTDYLVIQIVSGNAALDFPHINNIIYYSLHDSYIYFEQSKYRIRRIGQTNKCHYYYLIVKGTVEHSRLMSLKNKKSFNNKEFEIYKRREQDEY